MADVIGDINSKISGAFTGVGKSNITNAVGWIVFAIIVIGVIVFGYWYFFIEKKKYNKIIKVHEIINGFYDETFIDKAKTVKLGKGGFEIIYLKKLKVWKLAHGGRSGRRTYKFYIQPDGYWYPGQIAANVFQMDKLQGLIPIITTNPIMRAQYTALEKQIDALHGQKQNFWDKYGNWIMSFTFLIIMGFFAWMSFKEIGNFLGSGSALADQMTKLAEVMNRLAVNLNDANNAGGLTPAS